MDDFRGSCGSGKYPLLSAIASVLGIQSTGRSSFPDNDFDEFFPSETTRRGSESRSRDVNGVWPGRDRDRTSTTRYQSTRRRDRPVYTDDDDYDAAASDLDSPSSTRDDRLHVGRSAATESRHPRRRQQSPDFDDVTSGRSSRRRTTLADDLSDSFRRYDELDDNEQRSDRQHDALSDEVLPKRRGRPESTANDRRRTFGGRDGRRRAPDVVWNDDDRATSSTFSEEDLFANNRRADEVDGRGRFGSNRRRTNDFDDVPVDGE